jgi:hypothetical protein
MLASGGELIQTTLKACSSLLFLVPCPSNKLLLTVKGQLLCEDYKPAWAS